MQKIFNIGIALVAAFALVYCSSREHLSDEPAVHAYSNPLTPVKTPVPVDEVPVINPKAAFFDFDKSVLRPDAKAALRPTAEWLRRNASVHVQIEGFCDERGSVPYNLALGQNRANAAKAYLVSQGIDASRVTTLSFGRVEGESEAERRKNRRAGFVIIFPKTPSRAE